MGQTIISLTNGALGGVPSTNDSVSALLLTGTGSTPLPLNTPIKVSSLPDAVSQGITLAAEPFAYQHVSEFYSEAPAGTQLWVMLVANTTTMIDMVDYTLTTANARKLIDASLGTVRLFGAVKKPASDYVPVDYVSSGTPYKFQIDSDSIGGVVSGKSTIVNAQGLMEHYTSINAPIACLLGAMVYDITATAMYDTTNTSTPAPVDNVPSNTGQVVSFVVGGTTPDGIPSVGLALGRAAKNTVQRNIGAVEDGALPIATAYIGSFVAPSATTPITVQQYLNLSKLTNFTNDGFITLYAYMQKAGYYWSDDVTATTPTDDYNSLAHVRVINKVSIIAYQTFINKVNTDVLVNADGTLNAGVAKALEGLINNAVNTALKIPADPTATGIDAEASAFASSIDLTQNVVSTGTVTVVCKVTPKGYLKTINVQLGFQL